jgi:polyhydroxyalkanoate synthesis regulator phasin
MAVDVRKITADVRRYIEAALGNLSPQGARDLAKSMIERAQTMASQGSGQAAGGMAAQVRDVAQQLLDWSQQSREQITGLIQREVRRQLAAVGVASRDDLDTLRRRVRELEKAAGLSTPAKRTRSKSSAKPRAKRSSGSTAKRTSSTKRSGASTSSGSGTSSTSDSGTASTPGSGSGGGGS